MDKDIINPDVGANIEKNVQFASLSHKETHDPLSLEDFPEREFEVGINKIPTICYSQIWKYLIEDVELKKQLSVEKPIVKGYNFYKSGKVSGIYSKMDGGVHYIKSQVMPSYARTGAAYTVKIIVEASGNILKAQCPCPAGVDGRCNHLAATLFAIEDSQSKPQSTGASENVPCTSKPCKWSVPPKHRAQPTKIQETKFEKHIFKKKECKRKWEKSAGVCDEHSRHEFDDIYKRLKEIEKKKDTKIGLAYIIPHNIPVTADVPNISTATDKPEEEKWSLLSPLKDQPMSLQDIAGKASRMKQRLFESSKNRESIAKETTEQQSCRMWYEVRQPRITASQCKRCILRPTTSPTKAVQEVLMYGAKVQTRAMKEGIEWEPKIIEQFKKETGHQVHKMGFVISESHPFLGASPDGITEEGKLVEVKKVVSKEGEFLSDTLCRLSIYKRSADGKISLNRNHKYFYQIQQQLFCTKLEACHFIICNGEEIHTDIVVFHLNFWNEILPKLEAFYYEHMFPELVFPRLKHGEERWNGKELKFPTFG